MNEIKDLLGVKKKATPVIGPGLQDEGGDWPQSASAYELSVQIGQGAFAKVWQAHCAEKGMDVAIKIMELDNLTSGLDDIYQEVRVMLLSKNPCVLRAYACFVVKRSLWLVMPLMRKGSCLRIMKVLKRVGLGEGMKEEWIAAILKSALIGLEYFHQQGKLHRDIKASNLLMDSDGSVMISDFGVAGWLPNGNQDRTEGERRTFVGTPCWMAPEVMEQTQPYDEKADIWSFGITALELAKGYAPYARLQPMKVLLMTIQNPPPSLKSYEDYQATKNKYSRHFREIITLCLQKVPANRPSASTLLQKTFFKKAPDNSFLVKDLLEAVPIPDTSETSGQGDKEQQKLLEQIQMEQLEEALKQQARDDGSAAAEAGASAAGTAAGAPGSAAARTEDINADSVRDTLGNLRTHEVLSKLESATIGRSFVKGSTWVFDEDDSAQPAQAQAPAPQAPQGQPQPAVSAADTSGFDEFAKEYAMMDIKGEGGKATSG